MELDELSKLIADKLVEKDSCNNKNCTTCQPRRIKIIHESIEEWLCDRGLDKNDFGFFHVGVSDFLTVASILKHHLDDTRTRTLLENIRKKYIVTSEEKKEMETSCDNADTVGSR